jgi:hypothetical protein
MRINTIFGCALLTAALSVSASAAVITVGGTAVAGEGLKSSEVGATTVEFNLTPTNPNYTEDGVTYSGLSAGSITTGSVSGQCAAPPNDTSAYLCVGPNRNSPVTATFASLVNYFGFYVGSIDAYNSLEFFNGATKVLTLTGTEIATRSGIAANGNQSLGFYINIYASNNSEQFNKVVLISTQNALETDNHAFALVDRIPGQDSSVPEPSTYLTMIPAIGALAWWRKRKA